MVNTERTEGEQRTRADLMRSVDRLICGADSHHIEGRVSVPRLGTISLEVKSSPNRLNTQTVDTVRFTCGPDEGSRLDVTLRAGQDTAKIAAQDLLEGRIRGRPFNASYLNNLPDFRVVMREGVEQEHAANDIISIMLEGFMAGGMLHVRGRYSNVVVGYKPFDFIEFTKNFFPKSDPSVTNHSISEYAYGVRPAQLPTLLVPRDPDEPIGSDLYEGMPHEAALSTVWQYVDGLKDVTRQPFLQFPRG